MKKKQDLCFYQICLICPNILKYISLIPVNFAKHYSHSLYLVFLIFFHNFVILKTDRYTLFMKESDSYFKGSDCYFKDSDCYFKDSA